MPPMNNLSVRRTRTILGYLGLLVLMVLSACAGQPTSHKMNEVTALATAIKALGPEVDPLEADRAARIAFVHSGELALQYQITDPPLIHNTKVNMGLRPRGLCWHWAEDMETRLTQEEFETLDLHRAIANSKNPFRIEHSTTIISRKGDTMFDGIVLDPWRKGGQLTWIGTRADTDYKWLPQRQVLISKQERKRRRARN